MQPLGASHKVHDGTWILWVGQPQKVVPVLAPGVAPTRAARIPGSTTAADTAGLLILAGSLEGPRAERNILKQIEYGFFNHRSYSIYSKMAVCITLTTKQLLLCFLGSFGWIPSFGASSLRNACRAVSKHHLQPIGEPESGDGRG